MLYKTNIRNALLLACCLALLSTSSSFAQSENQTAQTWAVVIGIAKYPKLPDNQQLLFADKDAQDFAAAMQKVSSSHVRLLVNREATTEAIKEAIGNWLAQSANETDTVYLYFSGHAIAETEYGEAYLLAYDSDAKLPYSTGVSLRELSYAISRRVRANRVLIIADAARRDFFDTEIVGDAPSKIFTTAFNQLSQWRNGISTLLSTSVGEYSREGQKWNSRGVFTNTLIEALTSGVAGKADGTLNAEEVFNTIATRLPKETSKKQHAMKSGASLAQFVIAGHSSVFANAPAPVQERKEPATQSASTAQNATQQTQIPKSSEPDSTAKLNEPIKPYKLNNVEAGSSKITPQPNAESLVIEGAKKQQQTANQIGKASTNQSEAAKNTQPLASSTTNPAPQQPTPSVTVNKVEPPKSAQPNVNKIETAKTPPKNLNTGEAVKTAAPNINKLEPAKPLASESKNAGTASPKQPDAPPSAPVKSKPAPPAVAAVSTTNANGGSEPVTASIALAVSSPAPAPLLLDFEAAMKAGRLVDPKGNNAWDFYQQMNQQQALSADVARQKSRLAEALFSAGKDALSTDVRADNISDKVEDFKRAGQMLTKARSLTPEKTEIAALEKLSAAVALISLQFYDEAEKALLLLPKSAAAENALGIVYAGKLDTWKAERAFKNACEMEQTFAAPHYNLGLLYRSQKNEAALAEFEKAAELDGKNYAPQLAVGDEYFAQNKWQQAAEAYRKAVAARPFDDALHTKLGHALYSQGLREEANKEYQKAKEIRSKQ
jgi:tetratricopeptide (TPR) repeat protein